MFEEKSNTPQAPSKSDFDRENDPGVLRDPFARKIDYLRLSVTDRCDFRCFYCMSENMSFLPKKDLLTLEELERLCHAFIKRGIQKIRLTGGEPLVRRNIMSLIRNLSTHLDDGSLKELTMTTNASQLHRFADQLYEAGMRRVNISIDTRDPEKFARISRWGQLSDVIRGIDRALEAGLKVKLNAVALKGINDQEIPELIEWAHGLGCDITMIEVMPLGEIESNRLEQYLPLSSVRSDLETRYQLTDIPDRTGGPARYVRVEETGGRVGFITPLTNNFCADCNRVRVTCTGRVYMCLGHDDHVDLATPMRENQHDNALNLAIDQAIGTKPEHHNFNYETEGAKPASKRHMSVTGG